MCTSKNPFPEQGKGLEMTGESSRSQSSSRLPVKAEIGEVYQKK
jgi:hypothetical protein